MLNLKGSTSVALLVCLLGSGCTRDPEVLKLRYVASGDRYVSQKKYAEAVIEYSNAVVQDPRFGLARLKLADAHMAAGNLRQAFPEYIRAADLLPDNAEAQIKAGQLLRNAGLFEEAKNRARKVLQRDPKNLTALLLLGNSLAGMKNVDDAVTVVERAIDIAPDRAGLYTNLAVLQLAQGDTGLAEEAFLKAVSLAGTSPEPYTALGNFYRALHREDEAEQALKHALAIDANDVRANEAIASLYVEWERPKEAEVFLKKVAAITGDASSRFALADYYFAVGRQAEAVTVLDSLAADPKQYAVAKTRIAVNEYSLGHKDQAHAIVEEVLRNAPRSIDALTMKARLLLADGMPQAALAAISSAAEVDPNQAQVQLTLGRAQMAVRNIPAAKDAFSRSLKLDPKSLAAQLELANLHYERREFDTAISFADEAVLHHRNDANARLMLLRVLLVRPDDRVRAEAEARTLLEKFPSAAPAAFVALGSLALRDKDPVNATRAFERALSLNPDQVDALAGLVAIEVSTSKAPAALARVEAALARHPKDARLLLLAGRLYSVTGQAGKAEDTLRAAMAADPSDPTPYGLLGEIYISQHRIEEATRQFTEEARMQPASAAAPTMVGVLAYARNDLTEAKSWWEKALKADPNAAAAANNLAWLYAERDENLDVALQLAQIAKAKYPDLPEINDTLGWVYLRQGLHQLAISYLQQSIEKAPANPVYQYHLGMAFMARGEDRKARQCLQRALDLKSDFDGAANARKALASLVF